MLADGVAPSVVETGSESLKRDGKSAQKRAKEVSGADHETTGARTTRQCSRGASGNSQSQTPINREKESKGPSSFESSLLGQKRFGGQTTEDGNSEDRGRRFQFFNFHRVIIK